MIYNFNMIIIMWYIDELGSELYSFHLLDKYKQTNKTLYSDRFFFVVLHVLLFVWPDAFVLLVVLPWPMSCYWLVALLCTSGPCYVLD